MDPLPYPESPTQREVVIENNILRHLLFWMPPIVLILVMTLGVLIALCVAFNFNPMNWLE